MTVVLAVLLAATPIHLHDVEQRGRHNVQALTAVLDAQRAAGSVTESRAALLPQVSIDVTPGYSIVGPQRTNPTVVPTSGGFGSQQVDIPGYSTASYALGASLNEVIFDLGKWHQLEQAGLLADAAKGKAAEQADASELEAIRRFYALYQAQQSLVLLQHNVERSRYQLAQARGLFEAGKGSKSDVIAAQVNLGNDRISVIRQRSQIAAAQADLATWLAMPGTSDLVAVAPATLKQPPAPPPALQRALEAAHRQRPLLVATRSQELAAAAAVDAAKDQYVPRLGLSVRYQRRGPSIKPVFTDLSRQNEIAGSLDLSWDIFNGFSTWAAVGRAEEAQRQAQLQLAQTQREIDGAVRSALLTLHNQQDALAVATQNHQLAQQGLSVAQQRYAAGAATNLEVRDAQIKLSTAELDLLQIRTDVEVARANLARAMGSLAAGEMP